MFICYLRNNGETHFVPLQMSHLIATYSYKMTFYYTVGFYKFSVKHN